MEMKHLPRLVVPGVAAVLLSLPLAVIAEQTCFRGNQDSGELAFSGAVEETDFTGRFGTFSVEYCMPGGGPADGRIDVLVALSSADTENRERDQTLKGDSFFAVEQYPEAAWKSRSIAVDANRYRAEGELELKGIKAAQAVRFSLTPDGEDLIASGEFSMRGDSEVDRLRFDVGTGEFADPEFVRNRVDVTFEIRLQAIE